MNFVSTFCLHKYWLKKDTSLSVTGIFNRSKVCCQCGAQSQKVDFSLANPVHPTAASWYLVLCSSFSYRIVQIVPFVFRLLHHLDASSSGGWW